MQFQEKLLPSAAFAPGAWRVTTVTGDDGKASIDLGWSEDGTDKSYRYFGTFDVERTALLAIERIESLTSAPDLRKTISDAGFERISQSGFSLGGNTYRKSMEGRSAYLSFDGMGEATLKLENEVGGLDLVASLSAGTPHPELRGPSRQVAVATFVICSLLDCCKPDRSPAAA